MSTDVAASPQEREVLALLAAGLSNTEIGARLYLGTATVKDNASSLLAKFGVDNRVQAAIIAAHTDLVAPTAQSLEGVTASS
ncbi:LuxR C-terminal-related transcriptional regulator [Streptomyces syringium]|uniref:response regulator transcription factor n=1 Tax=Streptomyces syringium TaxID=76729 RepID=UPI00341873F3